MEKAASTVADAIVFDLEDAIPTAHVPMGRDNLQTTLETTDFGSKEVGVRINGLGTEHWSADLRAAVEAGVDAVLVPKVKSAAEVGSLVTALEALTDDPPTLRFAIESPAGMLAGPDIAERCRSIWYATGLTFGLADYCRTIGAPSADERIREHLTARVGTVAAAAGLDAFASTHLDVEDEAGVCAAAELARTFGYAGMGAIHPRQLPPINETFTPEAERVERARGLVAAYDDADVDSLRVEGTFLDEATVGHYRALIDRYEAIQRFESDDGE